jgi:CheY-like chemotaxis protein
LLRATIPGTIELKQRLDESAGTVFVNPSQIQQVILNLGSNAAQSMADGRGVLEIGLRRMDVDGPLAARVEGLSTGAHVCLSVQDDGGGMDSSTLARVFDPFFTAKEVGQGTGLGLSVAHGIVTGHGGAIQLESNSGKGTTFTLYFPRYEEEQAAAEAPVHERSTYRGSERILAVDDEPELALLVRKGLGRLGYTVAAFGESVEALEMLRADPDGFDAVITDQTMPKCTGLEMAEQLRCLRPDIPIVLTTGFNEAVTPERTESVGIDAVLLKPYSIEKLARSLRQVLDSGE